MERTSCWIWLVQATQRCAGRCAVGNDRSSDIPIVPLRQDKLKGLRKYAKDASFQKAWREVKLACKKRLVDFIKNQCGVEVRADALFDVQVKRLHEYKRQLLNILGVIHRYNKLRKMTAEEKKSVGSFSTANFAVLCPPMSAIGLLFLVPHHARWYHECSSLVARPHPATRWPSAF